MKLFGKTRDESVPTEVNPAVDYVDELARSCGRDQDAAKFVWAMTKGFGLPLGDDKFLTVKATADGLQPMVRGTSGDPEYVSVEFVRAAMESYDFGQRRVRPSAGEAGRGLA